MLGLEDARRRQDRGVDGARLETADHLRIAAHLEDRHVAVGLQAHRAQVEAQDGVRASAEAGHADALAAQLVHAADAELGGEPEQRLVDAAADDHHVAALHAGGDGDFLARVGQTNLPREQRRRQHGAAGHVIHGHVEPLAVVQARLVGDPVGELGHAERRVGDADGLARGRDPRRGRPRRGGGLPAGGRGRRRRCPARGGTGRTGTGPGQADQERRGQQERERTA